MKINQLLEYLNLSKKDGLFSNADLHSNKLDFLPNRFTESLLKINPDFIFCVNNEPLLLFFENPDEIQDLEKKIWNFNQCPAIFIKTSNGWTVKNGFKLLENKNNLEIIIDSNDIADFDYFEIITGSTWKKYKTYFEQKNRVDYYLLNNIEDVRNILTQSNYGNLPAKVANFLIGRVIFIRYLIDRNVELNIYGITNKEDFYTILSNKEKTYQFFQQVKDDFNGNLFPLKYIIDDIEIEERDLINESHLLKIKQLLKGGIIHKDNSYQTSLFDIYDFSIIPIEFISNVYEKFIGIEKQAKTGAYYTPLFLVDYIQSQTVTLYFKKKPKEFNCKVLDPACGSGIFLVETLRQIIFQYKKNNPQYLIDENYEDYKNQLKQLLINNIFGVDKDENAISVAIFSLYITLLDNLRPKSIVGFQFPDLIDTNFFVNDFFDTNGIFNLHLKKHQFRFILGNPPWATKHPKAKQLFEKYIERRKRDENSKLEIENREIAEAFLVRISDFDFDDSALIVTSKVLYKTSRRHNTRGAFRRYFLDNFRISQIFELSSVRHNVFDKSNDISIAPASIIFYSKETKGNSVKNNIIKHISLKPNIFFEVFKLIVIEKYDVKSISQNYFKNEDWIWKVLVYGNILDYFFIKRLKKNPSIYDYISDKKDFIYGKGISIGGGDKNIIYEHKKIQYAINSKEKGLSAFSITYCKNSLLDLDFIHRPRQINLFKAPVLLVGKGVTNNFRLKSSISYEDVIYTDAITGIKPLTEKGKNIISLLEALFNSELFSYFLVNTNSSIGIEREQSHDKEDKFSIPLVIDENSNYLNNIVSDIRKLLYLQQKEEFETIEKHIIQLELNQKYKIIEDYFINIYGITEQEKSLIDFTNKVTIPLLKRNNDSNLIFSKLHYKSEVLEKYANVFIEHFSKRFNSNERFFEVEIIYSNHTIMMKFKIINSPSENSNSIKWSKEGDKRLLLTLTKFGFENLSYNLFLQKDIKGFENDYFYIAKPNEFKSWHPALAYLDISEFINALHRKE